MEKWIGLCNILNSEVLWNFVTLISSFIIVKITMKGERRINRENIAIQEQQQGEQRQQEERFHNESIQIEKEQVRANLLPYLKLKKEINIGERELNLFFKLSLQNVGNGGAFDVQVEYKASEDNDLIIYDDGLDCYRYSGFLFDNVLPVGESGSFEILLDKYSKDKVASGRVYFSVLFKDSLYNQYRQKYMFDYNTNLGVGRVESNLPQLIKEKD